ncbi:MAG: ribbon-helix-helix protein, CopG family [Acidobacteria bacterium]|nr:ribbon-helix-helix protein, CopG family [Acidobacteriota bacterium]
MKNTTLTIRLDAKLERELDRACKRLRRSRSEVVREALRRQLAIQRFREIRAALVPLGEAQGVITDDDVFSIVS